MTIPSRIRDWQHERLIKRLHRTFAESVNQGAPEHVRRILWCAFVNAVADRSPEQVARMERGMRGK